MRGARMRTGVGPAHTNRGSSKREGPTMRTRARMTTRRVRRRRRTTNKDEVDKGGRQRGQQMRVGDR